MKQMKLLVLVAMLLTTTSLRAADGDVFTAQTAEGVTMTFKVISESLKTCQVGGNYGTGTAIPNDTQGRVTIPQKAKNYKVTTITYSAFNNCKYLEEIIIPEGVTTIESNAFMSCKKLGNVTFPESLTKIGHQTFGFCSNITSVFIPKNVTEIGNGGYDMGSSYTGCEKLTTITVSSENPIFDSRDNCNAIVETASNKLITGCGSTIIPNSISTIGYYAFLSCYNLEHIRIPASVSLIKTNSFSNCRNIKSIEVDENNQYYDSRNGCNAVIHSQTNELIVGTNTTIIPDDVVSIGDNAFNGRENMWSIKLPESVTTIKYSAFSSCRKLMEIIIPKGVTSIGDYAFDGCTAIKRIVFKGDVPSFGQYGDEFRNVGKATALIDLGVPTEYKDNYTALIADDGNFRNGYFNLQTLPMASVTYNGVVYSYTDDHYDAVGYDEVQAQLLDYKLTVTSDIDGYPVLSVANNTFYNKPKLKEVTISDGILNIGNSALSWCPLLEKVSFPESVLSIGEWCFYNTPKLTSVNIPSKITEIKPYTFYCLSLTEIEIPNSVQTIGERAFVGCQSLTNIQIPEAVTSIGEYAFSGCYKLAGNITLPQSIKIIPDYLFDGCRLLTRIDFAEDVTEIGEGAFRGCSGLTGRIEIPKGITQIKPNTFSSCSSLTEIIIPSQITNIGSSAFSDCKGITSIILPDGITTIGSNAFSGCSLTKIIIPSTVTTIERCAFRGQTLRIVIFQGDMPAGQGAIDYVGTSANPAILVVPEEYHNKYETDVNQHGGPKDNTFFSDCYFTLVTPTENLKVAAAGYATYYNSKADATLPGELIAYTVSGLRSETQPKYQIVSGNVVPAGMAVLLYSAEAEQEAVGKNYTLELDYTVTPDVTANDGNWLHGSDVDATTATEGTAKYYKLSYSKTDETQFGWHYGATDGAAFDIEAHRAWLAIPEGNNARELVLPNGKNTTGIQQMTANERQSDSVYYDLQGRAVKTPVSGMYIISSYNGRMSGKNVKKVIVK